MTTPSIQIIGFDILLSAGDRVGALPGGSIIIAAPGGRKLCAIEPSGTVTKFDPYRPDEAAQAFLSACASAYTAQLKLQKEAIADQVKAAATAGPEAVTPGAPSLGVQAATMGADAVATPITPGQVSPAAAGEMTPDEVIAKAPGQLVTDPSGSPLATVSSHVDPTAQDTDSPPDSGAQ